MNSTKSKEDDIRRQKQGDKITLLLLVDRSDSFMEFKLINFKREIRKCSWNTGQVLYFSNFFDDIIHITKWSLNMYLFFFFSYTNLWKPPLKFTIIWFKRRRMQYGFWTIQVTLDNVLQFKGCEEESLVALLNSLEGDFVLYRKNNIYKLM